MSDERTEEVVNTEEYRKKDTEKDFKICTTLGGLDVTRFVSAQARGFFASAIDDVQLLRELFVEAIGYNNYSVPFPSIENMAYTTLDVNARNLPPGTSSVDAGIGYVDDRRDRRIDRYMGLVPPDGPAIGTKQTDANMLESVAPILPWIVDRRSKKESWWKTDHLSQSDQGPESQPFLFDQLYTAAWACTTGGGTSYYPPLNVYGHPLTLGDVLGPNFNAMGEVFVTPTLPENNPSRSAVFTEPYPDVAVPGLSLISAAAPIYFTGKFQNYTYNDFYVGAVGIDIATQSVSSYLDVLKGTLSPNSFGLLVDSQFRTIVISQYVVDRIYPAFTGDEGARVTYDPNGNIVQDRRNQPYQPSDTILQPLTSLRNADWTGLLEKVLTLERGGRTSELMNVTLTTTNVQTEFEIFIERWQYVSDWILLAFVPKEELGKAIDLQVSARTNSSSLTSSNSMTSGHTTANESQGDIVISLKGERGSTLRGSGLIENKGNLDVCVYAKSFPKWIALDLIHEGFAVGSNETVLLHPGQKLDVGFKVSTESLDMGTQSSAIIFDVLDAEYPDCFFNQDLSLKLDIVVTAKQCSGINEDADLTGLCVCNSSSVKIGGSCVGFSVLIVSIGIPLVALALFSIWFHFYRKRRAEDKQWEVDKSELLFDFPPKIIGEGSFGIVLLAQYRGTQVAVKKFRTEKKGDKDVGGNHSLSRDSRASSVGTSSQGSDENDRICRVSFNSDEDGHRKHLDLENPTRTRSTSVGSSRKRSKSSSGKKSSSLSRAYRFFRSSGYNDVVKEMRLLSKLRHPNITTVMGAVMDKSGPMLVMEYMDQGSLADLIHNETVDFEGDILLPMLQDITNGIQFLHNTKPHVVHGDLKSHNVLVDSRFRAKVSDFGLSQTRGAGGTLYWMAPELLRKETDNTPATDVYALGIIFYEIYARKSPYKGEDYKQVMKEVCDPDINKRPPVPTSMPEGISAIMHDCLVADPAERPVMDEIASRFRRFKASEVEPKGLVRKVKPGEQNFDVLLKMFPRHIAEALRDGRKVEPENHESVTIFFSDIVGFTTISSSIPPSKVANMLDRLFNTFDKLADKHGVHKVETIGDAWMGVTNCVRNQSTDHARRIAKFAFDAVCAADQTLIDLDDPSRGHVQIRVGFHSGPVLTNVIGSANPRYSLFGDSVNTASRMESNSKPGKIHCSSSAAELLLVQAPEIQVKSRGYINIKGKGEMETFWVVPPVRAGSELNDLIPDMCPKAVSKGTVPEMSPQPQSNGAMHEPSPESIQTFDRVETQPVADGGLLYL